jgi:hypothetical protein
VSAEVNTKNTANAQAKCDNLNQHRRRTGPSVKVLRNAELHRLLLSRYGKAEWPDDDSGRDDLWLAVHSLTTVGKDDFAVRSFIKSKAPWLTERETVPMLDRAYALSKPYGSTKLGELLGLTDAVRRKLQLWHIDPIDISKEERMARKKRASARRRREKRRANGVEARADFEAKSTEREKPWLRHGMCRRSYYGWITKFEDAIEESERRTCNNRCTGLSPDKLSSGSEGDTPVQEMLQTPKGRRPRGRVDAVVGADATERKAA